jgi:hypothetical protein
MHSVDNIALADVSWMGRRIIPSRFPPIQLFERVVEPADLEVAFYIESLTNDRLRDEVGQLSLVSPEDRISGPGSSPIMAAFTHIGVPSRFTDGTFGAYYAASDSDTAIAETAYHRAKFLAATLEPDTRIYMREYVGEIILPMHDITGSQFTELYDVNSYANSQQFATKLKNDGSNGLLYNSVRNAGGLCVAAFKPKALSPVTQSAHYEYVYSARDKKISHVLEVKERNLKA